MVNTNKASINVFSVLWASYQKTAKTQIQDCNNNKYMDGPTLLHHFLKEYAGSVKVVIVKEQPVKLQEPLQKVVLMKL
eukprot:7068954-Ditylum_brightwellii.AAC.1